MAHTKGVPVATHIFCRFQRLDIKNTGKFVYAGSAPSLFKDLLALYRQGRSIIPVVPVSQHTGDANPTEDLTMPVAVDERGKAQGILFEDEADEYEYTNEGHLLTTYVADNSLLL